MDLGAQNQRKKPKSEGLQWDLRILELDLRFRGGLGLSPIGLEIFRGGLTNSGGDSLCDANVDSEEYSQDDSSTLEMGALMLLE